MMQYQSVNHRALPKQTAKLLLASLKKNTNLKSNSRLNYYNAQLYGSALLFPKNLTFPNSVLYFPIHLVNEIELARQRCI